MQQDFPDYFQNPHLDPSPFFLEGGSIGVLLIHGYTASPVEVNFIGKYLNNRGFTISGPLLPGHGTSIEDLHDCKFEDWTDFIEKAYHDLDEKCESVVVGGISLGGLLALHLGAKYDDIDGLITYAPALQFRNKFAPLAPYLKYLTKTLTWRKTNLSASIVDDRWCGYGIDSIPAISQFLQLQERVQQRLNDINQPIIIFQGMLDQSVDPSGAQKIYDSVRSEDKNLIWLNQSGHIVTLDIEWQTVAMKTADFVERVSP
jgi:carboxylesterase